MSGKWNDISTPEVERYELLAPTVRGVVERPRGEGFDEVFSACVEEGNGARHPADNHFDDLTDAKIWAENEMAWLVGRQTAT